MEKSMFSSTGGKSLLPFFPSFQRLSRPLATWVEREVRPRIGLSVELLPEGCEFPKKYVCHDNFLIIGFGSSMEEAYWDWYHRHHRRVRIPRVGHADLETCKSWYAQGCPPIEMFAEVRGQNLNVFSYDPSTDELILRG